MPASGASTSSNAKTPATLTSSSGDHPGWPRAASTAAASATSTTAASTSPPCAPIAATTSSAGRASRIRTRAPPAASRAAITLPMPPVAPVTTATRPSTMVPPPLALAHHPLRRALDLVEAVDVQSAQPARRRTTAIEGPGDQVVGTELAPAQEPAHEAAIAAQEAHRAADPDPPAHLDQPGAAHDAGDSDPHRQPHAVTIEVLDPVEDRGGVEAHLRHDRRGPELLLVAQRGEQGLALVERMALGVAGDP